MTAQDPSASSVELPGQANEVVSVLASPDSPWVVTLDRSEAPRLWRMRESGPPTSRSLKGHKGRVSCAVFSSDGRQLFTGGHDGDVRGWDLRRLDDPPASTSLPGSRERVEQMCVSRDGTLLVAAGWKTVRAWKVPAESPCKIPALLQLEDRVGIAALSADGQWLATGSGTNRPGLWNMNAQDPAVSRVLLSGYELMTEGSSISALMFSPDGQWLMTGSHDGIVRMWNLSLESLLILAADCTGRELTPAERRDYLLDL